MGDCPSSINMQNTTTWENRRECAQVLKIRTARRDIATMAEQRAEDTGTDDSSPVLSVKEVFSQRSVPKARVRGWVAGKAGVGGIVFLILRDGTGYLQVSAKKGSPRRRWSRACGMSRGSRSSPSAGQRGRTSAPGRRGAGREGLPGRLQGGALADNEDGRDVGLLPL